MNAHIRCSFVNVVGVGPGRKPLPTELDGSPSD